MVNKKNSYKVLILFLSILVVSSIVVFFVFEKTPMDKDVLASGKSFNIPLKKEGKISFLNKNNDSITSIDVEIANTEEKRETGLMYRNFLPQDGGMFFIQEDERTLSFWMKNTYISLDMVFINSNMDIVTIHNNTEKLKEWSYKSTKPAKYVIEVNAGFCSKYNIKVDDKIRLDTVFTKD